MLAITEEGRNLIRAALGSSLFNRGGPPPVSLPGPTPKLKTRKLNRDRFERFVGNTVLILRSYESSPFEFEAACRYGLRAHLCMEGWRWRDADQAAADVVEEGLRRIRATRPRWAEGQIDFAMETPVDRTHCVHCARPIPEERKLNGEMYGRSVKFCSDSCSVGAVKRRNKITGEQQTMAAWLARCAAKSQRRMEELALNCATCGIRFLPRDRRRKFCSTPCAVKSTTRRQPIECTGCGETFMQRRPSQVTCSRECGAEAQRKVWAPAHQDRACVICSASFRPKFPSDERKTCSPECSVSLRSRPRGRYKCEEVTT